MHGINENSGIEHLIDEGIKMDSNIGVIAKIAAAFIIAIATIVAAIISRGKDKISPTPDESFKKNIQAYCKKGESYNDSFPVIGFATELKVKIDIQDIYIPLRIE